MHLHMMILQMDQTAVYTDGYSNPNLGLYQNQLKQEETGRWFAEIFKNDVMFPLNEHTHGNICGYTDVQIAQIGMAVAEHHSQNIRY